MNAKAAMRFGVAALALGGVALLGAISAPGVAESQSAVVQDGKISFIVSDISFGLSDSQDPQAMCPQGLSIGPRDIFAATPEGQRREGESDQDYTRRVSAGSQQVLTAPDGQNLCMNPEAGAPDPNMHAVSGNVPVYGMDLDGQNSTRNGRAAPGTCAHDDFRGVNGERGVDNQFFRAVGCTNTYQPGGQGNTFVIEMLTGTWGILISLENVDNLRNDNDVAVHFNASNDPIELSPNREPLANATYAIHRDPVYRATTRGRIVNGVLTTEPVDVVFPYVSNSLRYDRPLRHARLRMTIAADGGMEGLMAGYSPVEGIYDTTVGFRNGRATNGELAPVRFRAGSAGGYASTARHTCHGVYHSLVAMADGDRDPATGRCTSISTQYRVRAIPAFVVNAATSSLNDDLAR